ncbi:MAG: hypothetical protein REI12_11330 [Pedobacter sp.]|nr:hypothetical protein [Pedobacter sp.]
MKISSALLSIAGPLLAAGLLAGCAASPLQQQILPAAEAANAATLVLSSKNESDRSTISVTAINDNSVLQKSNLLLKPGSYKITLKILQAPDQSAADGSGPGTWRASTTSLQADLKAGHRYSPRSSINGLKVAVSLEETASATK